MRLEDYTPDAICRCRGLPGFDSDPGLGQGRALRLLLAPSFDPETCLTFRREVDGVAVELVTGVQSIWHLRQPQRIQTIRDDCRMDPALLDDLEAELFPAAESGAQRGIMIDGMPLYAVHARANGEATRAEFNASWLGADSVLARVLLALWEAMPSAPARNALADSGKYVGLKLPVVEGVPARPDIRLVVLGEAEDGAQLADAIRSVLDPSKPGND